MKKVMSKAMNKTTKNNLITYAIVIAAFVIMQTLIATGSVPSLIEGIMVPVCIYVIMAVSLNLVVGILGELSLGHAGFMCVGAFSSAFFSKCMKEVITVDALRFFLAMLIGIAVAAVFGILIGIPVLRLKGDYLAIVTLAFGEIIKNLVNVLFIGKDSNGFHGREDLLENCFFSGSLEETRAVCRNGDFTSVKRFGTHWDTPPE